MLSECFLVGGAVRDRLLGIEPKDRDYVVVGATPQAMLIAGFKQVGKDFPVFIHPESGEEYALARIERKTGAGHQGFECNSSPDVTIEDDLLRRDLTMNAIAYDPDTDTYIDPYGGQADIVRRIIRHVSPAFAEDPLRVLRVARFAARYAHLGFTIAEETKQLMKEIVSNGELSTLTPERVWQELNAALTTPSPTTFFESLRDVGALQIILPEVDALWGIPQPEAHHPEIDAGVHTMMALQQARKLTDDPATLFGVLLHDVGKAVTPEDELPQHINHEKTGVPVIKSICERLKVPSRYKDFAVLFGKNHLKIHCCQEMNYKRLLLLLQTLDALRKPERLIQFGIAGAADAKGRLGREDFAYPQADYLYGAYQALKSVDMRQFNFSTERGQVDAHRARLNAMKYYIRSSKV